MSLIDKLFGPARDKISQTRERIAALEAERQHLLDSPADKASLIAALPGLIEALGARWLRDYGLAIVKALSGAVDVDMQAKEVTRLTPRSLAPLEEIPIRLAALCALAPGAVEAGLVAAIQGASYSEGVPRAELAARVGGLNRQLAPLEAEDAEIVDRAQDEMGISVPHLENTQARRGAERAASEWKERQARDQARKIR